MKQQQLLLGISLVVAATFRPALCAGAEGTPLSLTLQDGTTLSATVSHTGATEIDRYPKELSGSFQSISFPYGAVVTSLSQDSCRQIERMANSAIDPNTPDAIKKQYRTYLRHLTSPTVEVYFPTVANPQALWNEISKEARLQGLHPTHLTNPLAIENATLKLSTDMSAISRKLGDLTLIEQQLQSLISTRAIVSGKTLLVISALDLLCDLKSGKATLSLALIGQELNRPTLALTMPLEEGRRLNQFLWSHRGDFLAAPDALGIRRNMLRAGVLSERFRSQRTIEISTLDFSHSIEGLLDSDTAMPMELTESEVRNAITIVKSPHSAYDAKLTLEWNIEEYR